MKLVNNYKSKDDIIAHYIIAIGDSVTSIGQHQERTCSPTASDAVAGLEMGAKVVAKSFWLGRFSEPANCHRCLC